MTQEYTPTDRDIENAYFFSRARHATTVVEAIAAYAESHLEYLRWRDALDSRIRAEALTLTKKEHDIATREIFDCLMLVNRNDYATASEKAFSAVAEYRKAVKSE